MLILCTGCTYKTNHVQPKRGLSNNNYVVYTLTPPKNQPITVFQVVTPYPSHGRNDWHNEGIRVCMKEWKNMKEGMNDGRSAIQGGTPEWTKEGLKEWMKEGMTDVRNEWMTEWMHAKMKSTGFENRKMKKTNLQILQFWCLDPKTQTTESVVLFFFYFSIFEPSRLHFRM